MSQLVALAAVGEEPPVAGFAPVVIAVGLLVANGFFVAAEFALLASRRSRLEQLVAEGHRTARSALAGVRELSVMLAGAQLGITMASLGLGAIAEPAVARWLAQLLGVAGLPDPARAAVAFGLALAIVVFLHMVVGEMAPKTWAIANPERMALGLAWPFRAYTWAFRPLILLLNAAANGVVRAVGVEPVVERAIVHDPRDLLRVVAESGQRGRLPDDQQQLLRRVLSVTELDAESAMVPRPDILALSADADVDEIETVACRSGRSRLPVHGADLDDLIGVVHVKDLLAIPDERRADTTAASLARPALVVPESRGAEDLMRQMRAEGQHVALVMDEYGSVSGLVTLEDLIEELIGEFEDESDARVGRLRRRTGGTVVVPGSWRPDELATETGVELPEGQWETVAGFVLAELGHVPEPGEQVTAAGAVLTVEAVDGQRIARVAVAPTPDG